MKWRIICWSIMVVWFGTMWVTNGMWLRDWQRTVGIYEDALYTTNSLIEAEEFLSQYIYARTITGLDSGYTSCWWNTEDENQVWQMIRLRSLQQGLRQAIRSDTITVYGEMAVLNRTIRAQKSIPDQGISKYPYNTTMCNIWWLWGFFGIFSFVVSVNESENQY